MGLLGGRRIGLSEYENGLTDTAAQKVLCFRS